MTSSQSSFTILYVCTGNVCRSPFAELVTRRLIDGLLPRRDAARFTVTSAGTHAAPGALMSALSRQELPYWGVPAEAGIGHRARLLDDAVLARADLVLAAERHHRTHAVQLHPAALRVSFCLREFVRLLRATPPGDGDAVARARAAVDAAARGRGMLPPVTPAADTVPDPIGLPAEAHRRVGTMIATSVRELLDLTLRG